MTPTMKLAESYSPRSQGLSNLGRVVSFLAGAAKTWSRRRRAIVHLSKMDPWQLDDIGLSHHQIHDAVHGRFHRDSFAEHRLRHPFR